MLAETFLICALALPAASFTRPRVVSYHATNGDEDKLTEWLKKHPDIEEVFIHENPQENKLKEHFWERLPFSINGKQIWIKRKPADDKRKMGESA